MRHVVLLSGGLDSSLLCAYLKTKGHEVLPLFIERGQRNLEAERRAVNSVVTELRLSPALTATFNVPLVRQPMSIPSISPGLPSRNLILISIAAQYVVILEGNAIALGNVINDDFPDCKASFRIAASKTVGLSLGRDIEVVAPFADWESWSKAEVLKWAVSKNFSRLIETSWSCWTSSKCHCGQCGACEDRKEAFRLAELEDKTVYTGAVGSEKKQ